MKSTFALLMVALLASQQQAGAAELGKPHSNDYPFGSARRLALPQGLWIQAFVLALPCVCLKLSPH